MTRTIRRRGMPLLALAMALAACGSPSDDHPKPHSGHETGRPSGVRG